MMLSAVAANCRLLVPLLPLAAAASCLLLLLRLRSLLFFSMCVLFLSRGRLTLEISGTVSSYHPRACLGSAHGEAAR